jgi:hypothetical protein
VLTTNFFFPKEIENEVYEKNAGLYPRGINPTSVAEDFELRVDKNASRHDTLVMKVAKDEKGNLTASYTVAMV